jgi:hypothetical protein
MYKVGDGTPFVSKANVAWIKCRANYFKNWTTFQKKRSLVGSDCEGDRFTDNGDGSVTDNLTRLTWEKKDDAGGIHDKDNFYTWSTGAPWNETGTIFTDFLATLNGTAFAGSSGWRLPTFAELQTLLLDYPCTGEWATAGCECETIPCVDAAIGTPSPSGLYASSTTWPEFAHAELDITFGSGGWFVLLFCPNQKACGKRAIAVRGGW